MSKKQSKPVPLSVTTLSDEAFITPREVAERLHIKVSTIHDWSRGRNTNPLPRYVISKKAVYFKWSEVSAWIQSQRVAV